MEYFLYALAILLTLAFLGFQFYPYFKLKNSRGREAPVLNHLLEPRQQNQPRTLVYFMAPQCGMCKHTTPIIDELAAVRNDVIRIDASEHPEIAQQFGILGTPAFILVDQGKIERVKLGSMSRNKIVDLLK